MNVDFSKWSKKAKIAGLVITTLGALTATDVLNAIAGAVCITVTGITYLIVQGSVDEQQAANGLPAKPEEPE